jgi:hypothetical protein
MTQYGDYQFDIYFGGFEGQLPRYPVDFAALERAETGDVVGPLLPRAPHETATRHQLPLVQSRPWLAQAVSKPS